MAIFVYRSNSGNQTYEGDFMSQKEEFVHIMLKPRNHETVPAKVAVIRLQHGESVERENWS